MNILVYINAANGVALHRLMIPYGKIAEISPTTKVRFFADDGTISPAEFEKMVTQFDIFVFSRAIRPDFLDAANRHCITVCDQDDSWQLTQDHPLYNSYNITRMPLKIVYCSKNSDYLTVTTELLKSKFSALNPNVAVFNNALTAEGLFAPNKKPSKRLRFGFIGGSSHTADMELLRDINIYLDEQTRDKIQFVLCGFDKGVSKTYVGDKIVEQQMPWETVCWVKWEKMLTDDYKLISPGHRDFLLHYQVGLDDIYEDEFYRRVWTRGIDTYATLFDECDVLIAPLVKNNFNIYKSPLKMAEASVKDCGLIISDVEPYREYIKNGNCIGVRPEKRAKGIAKAIKRFIYEDGLLLKSKEQLKRLTERGGEFDLYDMTMRRLGWLNKISDLDDE